MQAYAFFLLPLASPNIVETEVYNKFHFRLMRLKKKTPDRGLLDREDGRGLGGGGGGGRGERVCRFPKRAWDTINKHQTDLHHSVDGRQ